MTESHDGPAEGPLSKTQRPRSPRPRDAASIMLLDRSQAHVRVLVGKRNKAHVFMPDLHVFPGGRRDTSDHKLPWAGDIHPTVLERLKTCYGHRASESRLRAIALAALRELHEEASIAVGRKDCGNTKLPFLPDLHKLALYGTGDYPSGISAPVSTPTFSPFSRTRQVLVPRISATAGSSKI